MNNKNAWAGVIADYRMLAALNQFGIDRTIDFVGTPVPYDEERDSWEFKPVIHTMKNETATPEKVEVKQQRHPFWVKLFGQKA